jgi:hypothetical protein
MAPICTFTSGTDWNNTTGKWGIASNLTGSLYAYAGTMTGTSKGWHAGVDTTAGVMDIGVQSGTTVGPGNVGVGDYAGGGMAFDADDCVNTSTWTGVEFTLGGTSAGCDVFFQLQTYVDKAITNGGGCDAGCNTFPQVKVAIGTDPITVHFSDLSAGGKSDAGIPIAMQIVGLQWQMQSAAGPDGGVQQACTGAELTVDNVSFVSN